MSGHETNSSY